MCGDLLLFAASPFDFTTIAANSFVIAVVIAANETGVVIDYCIEAHLIAAESHANMSA